jgi:hypothetical protein
MSQDILPSNTQELLIQSLGDLEDMVLTKEHPCLDRFTIRTDASGLGDKQPIMTGWGGGVSGTFEDSLENAKVNAANAEAFEIEPAIVYGNSIIDWSSSRYTRGKSSAIDVAILGTKSAMENATDNFCYMAFGTGYGTLARIKTATNTAGSLWTLKLYNPVDVAKFAQDMVLQQKQTPAFATLEAGSCIVKGMGHLGGFIRVDVGATGMVPTADYYIGLKGQILASTDVATFPGIFGYIPSTDDRDADGVPTVTTFLSVPRGVDSPGVATSGWAFALNGNPFFTTANFGAGLMSNFKNARPDTIFLNGADVPKLAQECNANVRYDMPAKSERGARANVLYSGFNVNLSTGPAEVLSEMAVPAGYAVVCKADQWEVKSPGKMFAPATNGQIMVPSYDKNRSRCSVECSGFFTTPNPPATMILKLY